MGNVFWSPSGAAFFSLGWSEALRAQAQVLVKKGHGLKGRYKARLQSSSLVELFSRGVVRIPGCRSQSLTVPRAKE